MGKVMSEKDEELALFFEMRRLEKENEANNSLLLQLPNDTNNSDELDPHPLESNNNNNNNQNLQISKSVSSMPQQRKSRVEEFLNSENDKSDYDWLITPPGSPLLPSVEMGSQKTATSQVEIPTSRPTALRSRPANIQVEPASRRNIVAKNPTLPSELNTSTTVNRRPSSSEGHRTVTRRSATPTGRPTLPSTAKSSRSSTPITRASLPSAKNVAPPVRSSTPARSLARSSTPTARSSLPASKSSSRSATPTRQPSTSMSAPGVSVPTGRASSASKIRPTSSKSSVPSRGPSPTVKSRPWKPSEMPGFSVDAPPNLKTSLPDRPASASRGRPVAPIIKSSSTVTGSNGRVRQQSCSPSRARVSHSSVTSNGISTRVMSKSRCSDNDEVSPVLLGTQMVERVVNMRKLAPPKRDNDHSVHNYSAGKSLSSDSSGFGRSLSKKSLDMALRHMDIRRSMQGGSLRPLVTSIPASSMYSIRSGSTKSRTISNSDSPLATSSNASSEPSVNNTSLCFDGSDVEGNDVGNYQGNSFSASQQGL